MKPFSSNPISLSRRAQGDGPRRRSRPRPQEHFTDKFRLQPRRSRSPLSPSQPRSAPAAAGSLCSACQKPQPSVRASWQGASEALPLAASGHADPEPKALEERGLSGGIALPCARSAERAAARGPQLPRGFPQRPAASAQLPGRSRQQPRRARRRGRACCGCT